MTTVGRTLPPCLLLVLICGCGINTKPQAEAVRKVDVTLAADHIRLLDLRFRHAVIEISQEESKQIHITGELIVSTSDPEAARLRAEELEIKIQRGGFTRLTLPDPGEGFDYTAGLRITVPPRLNLNAVLGSGEINAVMDLPLKTDLQVGAGRIRLVLPPSTAAFVSAQSNVGQVEVKGFDQIKGESQQQFSSQVFNGQIGSPMNILGNQIEARMNEGTIEIIGERDDPPQPAGG